MYKLVIDELFMCFSHLGVILTLEGSNFSAKEEDRQIEVCVTLEGLLHRRIASQLFAMEESATGTIATTIYLLSNI